MLAVNMLACGNNNILSFTVMIYLVNNMKFIVIPKKEKMKLLLLLCGYVILKKQTLFELRKC